MGYVPRACGFVLVREGARGWEYLLLRNRLHGAPGVPKGHVQPGESDLEAALRETREETGLETLLVDPRFRVDIGYPVRRKGRTWDKTVVLFLARTGQEDVALSEEHASFAWLPLAEALGEIPFENLRHAVREAALYLKDRQLFAIEPATEADAAAHLATLPAYGPDLGAHLEGGARLARILAEAIEEAGRPVDVEATVVAARLHDVGRALGRHADHPLAGLEHLRRTPLAAYAFACVSHFTKGAFPQELVQAGVRPAEVEAMGRLVDLDTLTWEEHCIALADSCMRGGEAVPPGERFADLRRRYDAGALIDLQERRTDAIRRLFTATLGRDPLTLLRLD